MSGISLWRIRQIIRHTATKLAAAQNTNNPPPPNCAIAKAAIRGPKIAPIPNDMTKPPDAGTTSAASR